MAKTEIGNMKIEDSEVSTTQRNQLMRQSIIRRTDRPPAFALEELKKRFSYARSYPFGWKDYSADLAYRKSRWSWIAYEKNGIRRRQLFCWIKLAKRRIAALKLFEYEASPELGNEDFLYLMDHETQLESDLAGTLCGAWPWFAEQVTDRGNLLEFRMAWTHPTASPHGLWSAAARHLIAQEFPDHALLIMKAFPLEYEGVAREGAHLNAALLARQRAMIRYYGKQFGVQTLQGASGEKGWLYRINPRFAGTISAPAGDERALVAHGCSEG
jgi:hypothetical protein